MDLIAKLFEVLFPVFLTIGIGYWYGKKDPKFDTKFIYDIGCQLMFLKENRLGVKYISPTDIVIINSNIFLFINPNMLFELLNKKHIAINKPINSYEYGIVERSSVDLNSTIAPEFLGDYDYIYYTCSFYSFAKLFQEIFNLDVEDLVATSVYYFLKRCLEKSFSSVANSV